MPNAVFERGIKLALNYADVEGDPYSNILWFQIINPRGPDVVLTDLQELCVAVDSWDAVVGRTIRGSQNTLESIVATSWDALPQEQYFFTPTTPRPGTATGSALPSNVAFCISLRTRFIGRSFRGRLYAGGLTEAQVGGDRLVAGEADRIRDAYVALDSDTTSEAFTWVVASFFSEGVPRLVPVASVIENITYTDDRVDTQRRRLS